MAYLVIGFEDLHDFTRTDVREKSHNRVGTRKILYDTKKMVGILCGASVGELPSGRNISARKLSSLQQYRCTLRLRTAARPLGGNKTATGNLINAKVYQRCYFVFWCEFLIFVISPALWRQKYYSRLDVHAWPTAAVFVGIAVQHHCRKIRVFMRRRERKSTRTVCPRSRRPTSK